LQCAHGHSNDSSNPFARFAARHQILDLPNSLWRKLAMSPLRVGAATLPDSSLESPVRDFSWMVSARAIAGLLLARCGEFIFTFACWPVGNYWYSVVILGVRYVAPVSIASKVPVLFATLRAGPEMVILDGPHLAVQN
jgi:hypothetical protein